jgi:hypothetical protein
VPSECFAKVANRESDRDGNRSSAPVGKQNTDIGLFLLLLDVDLLFFGFCGLSFWPSRSKD